MKRTCCDTTPKGMILISGNMEFHTTFKKQIIIVSKMNRLFAHDFPL